MGDSSIRLAWLLVVLIWRGLLAGIIFNFDLSDQQEQQLVTEYRKQSGIKVDIEKLEAMKDLYRIISELWYMENEQSCRN